MRRHCAHRSSYCRLTDHHSRRHGVPFEPECDEGAGYQNNAWDENRGEVEGAIPREDQIHLQAAVITWVTHTHNFIFRTDAKIDGGVCIFAEQKLAVL